MSHTINSEFVARIARRGLALAALLALFFAGAAVSRAQSTAASAPDPAAKPAAASAKMPPAPARDSSALAANPLAGVGDEPALTASPLSSAAEKPPAKGQHEGIKVHGHWIIEVKNPDGSVDRHVEFENALCITNSNLNGYGGDALLTLLLTGFAPAGGWEVQLGNAPIPTGANPGPACGASGVPGLLFVLEQSNDGSSSANGSCLATPNSCFPTLNPPAVNPNFYNSFTLSGQFTVPQGAASTQITTVGTVLRTCGANDTPANCLGSTNTSVVQFTGAYLTGVAPLPPPVPITAAQSVSVNVQFSFQ